MFHEVDVEKVKKEEVKKEEATAKKEEAIVKACHDLSEGGIAVAASEMALAGGLGVELDLMKLPCAEVERDDFALFSESNSRFLVEVAEADKTEFESQNCSPIRDDWWKGRWCNL